MVKDEPRVYLILVITVEYVVKGETKDVCIGMLVPNGSVFNVQLEHGKSRNSIARLGVGSTGFPN